MLQLVISTYEQPKQSGNYMSSFSQTSYKVTVHAVIARCAISRHRMESRFLNHSPCDSMELVQLIYRFPSDF